jgi:membrane-bound lytic murein transglycosylase
MIAALASAAVAAGCASKPPRPTEEMTRAQTLLDQAEQSGAQQFAAAELTQARQKLKAADDATDKGNTVVAARLASEATADARLAVARTNAGKAATAAGEVSESVETLRREANRGTNTSGTP